MKKMLRFTVAIMMVMFMLTPTVAHASQVHRVARGESLYTISTRYGITVDELISKNGYLRNPSNIGIGQVLIVPKQQEANVYVVHPGDTLYKISQKLGVSIAEIAGENNIENWNNIYVGQRLSIPNKGIAIKESSSTYVVKSGDTLYKIAQKLGISMENLAQANGLRDWNLLHVGQTLNIPSGKQVVEPKPQPEPTFKYTTTQLARMYRDTFYLRASKNSNKIALTFDDGPHEKYTNEILDVLKQYNVPATFFVMGGKAQAHPQIIDRAISEGHVIGNHTWTHPDLRKVTQSRLIDEMQRTEDAIYDITKLRTALMRPPYGAVSEDSIEGLKALNYKVINWSVDSVDWRDQDVDQILMNTLPSVDGGGIVLFHDAGGAGQSRAATVSALPEIIETLKMQGYEFVTVDKLLDIPAYR
ncbi:MAG: LysM peptidoglycan-binding domain-containing protein [Clostridiaceae bacterium]|nr:LysM peptidoglycan-binding domain-containing protein [Clostridiaceae bacterium]